MENFARNSTTELRGTASTVRSASGAWRPKSKQQLFPAHLERKIGEGTYGSVYASKDLRDGSHVAIKKTDLSQEKEGFPIVAIREIKLLQKLSHKNVVKLKEVVSDEPDPAVPFARRPIYLVFEMMDFDLTGLRDVRPAAPLDLCSLKHYMRQILEGIAHLHAKHVMHRDLKGANILLNRAHEVKIADFGLGRPLLSGPGAAGGGAGSNARLTNPVVTLWYRAPEVLLGDCNYGPPIDIWSCGCLLAELMTGHALFSQNSELEQLRRIFKICGTPNDDNWPTHAQLPGFEACKPSAPLPRTLRERFTELMNKGNTCITPCGIDLLDGLLALDPSRRLSAKDAVLHAFFFDEPPLFKAVLAGLPVLPTKQYFEYLSRRDSQQRRHPNAPPPAASASSVTASHLSHHQQSSYGAPRAGMPMAMSMPSNSGHLSSQSAGGGGAPKSGYGAVSSSFSGRGVYAHNSGYGPGQGQLHGQAAYTGGGGGGVAPYGYGQGSGPSYAVGQGSSSGAGYGPNGYGGHSAYGGGGGAYGGAPPASGYYGSASAPFVPTLSSQNLYQSFVPSSSSASTSSAQNRRGDKMTSNAMSVSSSSPGTSHKRKHPEPLPPAPGKSTAGASTFVPLPLPPGICANSSAMETSSRERGERDRERERRERREFGEVESRSDDRLRSACGSVAAKKARSRSPHRIRSSELPLGFQSNGVFALAPPPP